MAFTREAGIGATSRRDDHGDAGERVVETCHQARRVGGDQPTGVAQHHDAAVGEKRWCRQRVDDHADVEIIR